MHHTTDLYKKLTIKKIRQEAGSFKTFVFEDEPFIAYQPGQYLTLVDFVHGMEVRRSYSIMSSPLWNEPLTIGVKRIDNGYFSRKLIDHAKVGDQIMTTGAGGFFTLPEEGQSFQQIFFLAAGSGITPIFSLLKSALLQYPHIRLILIYSNPSPEKTVFREELLELSQQYSDRLHIEFLFSNSKDLAKARLYPELLIRYVNTFSFASLDESLFYICGPESYMRMCTFILLREKVPEANVRREHFVIHKRLPSKVVPPDKEKHSVTIHYNDKVYQFPVQYPQTILGAARKEHITLPYSCEVGRCGNCAARCTSGSIWMSYNEVLTDKELKKGMILTCVAYPVGGDVVVNI